MRSSIVFDDRNCNVAVDEVLFEGRTYYVRFPTVDAEAIEAAVDAAGLNDFLSWHRLNSVAILRIVNKIGILRFFDEVFDVRSEKLLEGRTGRRQFAVILDDLSALARDVRFQYKSTTGAVGAPDARLHDASLLERFSYYKHLTLDAPPRVRLEALISYIVGNAKCEVQQDYMEDYIWAARRPTQRTLASAFRKTQNLVHAGTSRRSMGGRALHATADSRTSFVALRASLPRPVITTDTAENRFVKHVLRDVESVCTRTLALSSIPRLVLRDALRMLNIVRGLLRNSFFENIGALNVLPVSSPSLATRRGYSELFRCYLQSRLGIEHIFDGFSRESMFLDLKDVADLYEYWTFYRVAASVFGKSALVDAKSVVIKNGKVAQAISLSVGDTSVEYNTTFSRVRGTSYSMSFRPDIIIRVKREGATLVILLDAKYRSDSRDFDDMSDQSSDGLDLKRSVNPTDIQKMHCYLDAIDGAACAMVIYPGTDFVFYPKESRFGVARNANDLIDFRGVGAIPLLPGNASTSEAFESLVEKIKGWPGRRT